MSSVDATYRQILASFAGGELVHPATPAPAVACVLWRRRHGEGEPEVYLTQRAPQLSFLGGTWCFPGGRIDQADADMAAAAQREVREETGLSIDIGTEPTMAGRWITPEFAPVRFDTSYLLVRVPEVATFDARRSGGEVVATAWLTPCEALARWRTGRMILSPPVQRVLEVLCAGIDDGTPRALGEAARAAASAPRLWSLAPGVAVCPLRTPTLPPATHTNCVLIGGDDIVVIDPASPDRDEQAELDRVLCELEARGRRVRAIWLTHHHADHVGGVIALAKARRVPVAAHPETASRLSGRIQVDEMLEDGHVIELPGSTSGVPVRRLRCLFTPGHAAGHLCFVEETTRFVVAGDMVAGVGTILIDPADGDMAQYLDSLGRLRGENPRCLVPAHGGVIVDSEPRLSALVQHRLWREARVLGALAPGGRTAAELVKTAYQDVSPAIWPLAERSLLAHLHKLKDEGRASQAGELWSASTKTRS